MAMALRAVDNSIISNVTLVLLGSRPDWKAFSKQPQSDKDVRNAKAKSITRSCGVGSGGYAIEFQFPPKVTSDTKDAEWAIAKAGALPPIPTFKHAGPRKISLKWEYIVTSKTANTISWTAERISKNVKKLRGYFNAGYGGNGAVAGQGAKGGVFAMTPESFIAYFKYGAFGGNDAKYQQNSTSSCYTFYMESVDVKHGDTVVYPNEDPTAMFPLKTEVSVTLIEWVSGFVPQNQNSAQNISLVVVAPTEGWF